MRIDLEWLQQKRDEAASDADFLYDCLRGEYRSTAKIAAGEAMTCAQSFPFPSEDDPTGIADLLMQVAADAFEVKHLTYASELAVGDVIVRPGGERQEVTGHRFYVSTTGRGRRFAAASIWFDGEEEPSEVAAEYRYSRVVR